MGLLLADFTIFAILTFVFAIFVLVGKLFGFYAFFGEFVSLTIVFGVGLISMTYLISHVFNSQNTAIKWIYPILSITGSILPAVLMSFASLT
jgi:hypothetical protein